MATQLVGTLHGIHAVGAKALPMVLRSGEGVSGGVGLTSLTESLVTGLNDIVNQLMTALGQIVPIVLLVVGGVVVVKFGINMFKKFGSAS